MMKPVRGDKRRSIAEMRSAIENLLEDLSPEQLRLTIDFVKALVPLVKESTPTELDALELRLMRVYKQKHRSVEDCRAALWDAMKVQQ
jgi:hypothetical protein